MISQIMKSQSGMRLRSLALLLQLLAVILISLTFMLIVRDNLLRAQILFENSTTVIFEAETSSQLEASLQLFEVSISQAIIQKNRTLISMQQLYTLIETQQEYIYAESQAEYLLDDGDDIYNTQQFRIKSELPLDPAEYQQIVNYTSLLNEYVFQFAFFDDVLSIITYIDYGSEGLYLQYPRTLSDQEAISFSTDIQFEEFKSQNVSNQLIFPFFNIAGGPIYLIFFSQLKKANSVEGALRYDQMFDLTQFPQLYNIIADKDWNIHTIFGVMNYTSPGPLIPDPNFPEFNITFQALTGFTQDDWVKIMTQEQSFVYNIYVQRNVFAKKKQFKNNDMLLVMYQDVRSYLIEQEEILASLQAFAREVIQKFCVTIVICLVVCGLVQTIIIIKILQPLSKLMQMVQNQIFSITKNDIRTSFFQQLEFNKLQVDQSLKKLYSAIILQKKRSSEQKSIQLNNFQELIYPRRNNARLEICLEEVFNITTFWE